MKRFILLSFITIIVSTYLQGQNYKGDGIPMVKDIFQAPPDVMAFQKVNMIPVSLYTGKANINIPIYEIDLEGTKIPISLTYNTGGIRVNDIASSVGLGWSLNAGGYVTKEIKDIDDNALTFDQIVTSDDTGDNAGSSYYLLNTVGKHRTPWQKIIRTDGTVLDITKQVDKQDALHDIYSINAPDINGNFIIENITPNLFWQSSNGENSYNVNIPYGDYQYKTTFINNSFIKNIQDPLKREQIEFPTKNYGSGISLKTEEFTLFNFKNEKGFTYSFGQPSFRVSRPNFFTLLSGLSPGDSRLIFLDKIATSWPLELITGTKGKFVEFKYQRNSTTEPIVKSNSITKEVGSERTSGINFYFTELRRGSGSFYPSYYRNDGSVGNLNIENTNINKLSQINFDKGFIHFYYDLEREDLPGEKALTKIEIKTLDNETIKTYRFYYKYNTSSSGCSDSLCKRLFLTKVSEMNGSSTSEKSSYNFSYNEAVKLPSRYSLEQDYLGFYNKNGQTEQPVAVGEEGSSKEQYLNQHIPSPKLYFYSNQGKNSILPFKLSTTDSYSIPGDYSLEPDERYAFAGILTQMKFPTGATIDFKYELHTFNFKGEQVKAGGARLKQQIIKDENNVKKTLHYRYEEVNGNTSGYINNIPVYGYPNSLSPVTSFTVYDTNKSGIEFTEGSYVGYSRVLEVENGNGYTEYIYTSPKDYPNDPEIRTGQTSAENFLINNSAFPNLGYFDYDIKRGKLISKKVVNSSNQLVNSEKSLYTYKKFNTIDYTAFGYVDERDPPAGNYYDGGFDPSFYHHDIETKFSLNIERYLLTKMETSEYFDGKELTISKELQYDNEYPLIEKEHITNSQGEVIETSYQYAHEKNNTRMITENRIAIPLQTTIKKGSTTVSDQLIKYNTFGELYLPEFMFQKKGAAVTETETDRRLIYDRYDTKGNLLQYHTEDGLTTSILWGYNGQYPIAKIEGAPYDQISGYASNPNGLRTALPGAMITTYTYEPLVGVTSITAPNGQTQAFTYDEFNRLWQVKDHTGKILKEYTYHYKGETEDGGGTPTFPELEVAIGYGQGTDTHQTFTSTVSGGNGNYTYAWYQGIEGSGTEFETTVSSTNASYTMPAQCNTTKYVKLVVQDGSGKEKTLTKRNSNSCTLSSTPKITSVSLEGTQVRIDWTIEDGSPNNGTSTWIVSSSYDNGATWSNSYAGGSPRYLTLREQGVVQFKVKRLTEPETAYSSIVTLNTETYESPKVSAFTSIADYLDNDPYGDNTGTTVCITAGSYAANIYIEQFYADDIQEGMQLYIDETTPITSANISALPSDHRLKSVAPNGVKLIRFVTQTTDPSTVWEVDSYTGKLKGKASRSCN